MFFFEEILRYFFQFSKLVKEISTFAVNKSILLESIENLQFK